jgi:hypothetical protein
MQYDAVVFLESLFRPVRLLPQERDDRVEERAAIMEFDAGLPREQAEHFADLDIKRWMREV